MNSLFIQCAKNLKNTAIIDYIIYRCILFISPVLVRFAILLLCVYLLKSIKLLVTVFIYALTASFPFFSIIGILANAGASF